MSAKYIIYRFPRIHTGTCGYLHFLKTYTCTCQVSVGNKYHRYKLLVPAGFPTDTEQVTCGLLVLVVCLSLNRTAVQGRFGFRFSLTYKTQTGSGSGSDNFARTEPEPDIGNFTQIYSCAYDSLFTVMYNLWKTRKNSITNCKQLQGIFFQTLFQSFLEHEREQITLENARDKVRQMLHRHNRRKFPNGSSYADMVDLCTVMFESTEDNSEETVFCDNCNSEEQETTKIKTVLYYTIMEWLQDQKLYMIGCKEMENSQVPANA